MCKLYTVSLGLASVAAIWTS